MFILLVWGTLATQLGGQTRYADLSLSSLFSSGWSSAGAENLLVLQGGAHDPNKRGFTVQNVELSLMGAVDPFLRGEAHLIFQIDAEGESIFELEEAFLTTQTLAYGLQVKAGTYFTEFGRLNPQHPHSWSYVDQPVINTRLLGGDGLRGPGVRVAWLSPLPWYAELFLGIQNANGETAVSFLNSPEEDQFLGRPLVDRELGSVADLLRSARWLNSFNLGEATTVNLGASALWGPNATGEGGKTNIYGGDIYLKWQPLANDQGWPFVAVQGELMHRNYLAAAHNSELFIGVEENLTDFGWYAQLQWGFKRGWVSGVRYESAAGSGKDGIDPLRDQRTRVAGNLTYYPSEFSKVRLQLNLDSARFLDRGNAWGFWVQYEFLLGQHAGHKF
ncbi:MAG: hypothetical protein IID14_08605 [Candidatus Marinimicrobia bacterium]|nr:hypothetical protein [Candidatus Neomarinimicrobiota bacterium]